MIPSISRHLCSGFIYHLWDKKSDFGDSITTGPTVLAHDTTAWIMRASTRTHATRRRLEIHNQVAALTLREPVENCALELRQHASWRCLNFQLKKFIRGGLCTLLASELVRQKWSSQLLRSTSSTAHCYHASPFCVLVTGRVGLQAFQCPLWGGSCLAFVVSAALTAPTNNWNAFLAYQLAKRQKISWTKVFI